MSERQTEKTHTLAPCGRPYVEPPDEEIQPGDYHYFNGLTHCSCGRWVRPGEHPTLPANYAAERLWRALEEINDTAVAGDFKVGAAYALGVLAHLAEAGPGSTWMDVARAIVTPPAGGEG